LPYRFRTKLEVQPIADQRRRRDFEPRFDSGRAIVQTETAWGRACRRRAGILFFQLIARISLLVFVLVSAAIEDENNRKFIWLWHHAVIGQGHHASPLRATRGASAAPHHQIRLSNSEFVRQ